MGGPKPSYTGITSVQQPLWLGETLWLLVCLFRLPDFLHGAHPKEPEIRVVMIIVEVVVVIPVVDIDAFRQPELYVVLLKRYRSVID